jgi:amino-acid N-acetyltransferase
MIARIATYEYPDLADRNLESIIYSRKVPDPSIVIRRARTADVPAMRRLVELFASERILLAKAPVQYYEDVQEFFVGELDGELVGCGALHVLWEDLAEIRSVAVDPQAQGHGLGSAVVSRILDVAQELGIQRLFVLTFETRFFERFGFREIEGAPVAPDVYQQLLQSFDEGVAEFLELERVKPNTLGNSRMLLELGARADG